jgi:hypothetical protein
MPEQENISKNNNNDLTVKPLSFMTGWGLPMIILTGTNFISVPYWIVILVIAATFLWMGACCLINAQRCHRRHCYYSGPIFLIGAALTLVFGFGILRYGQDDLTIIVWGTVLAVFLTFIPERIWGKYKETE